jgi:hypothetical protein
MPISPARMESRLSRQNRLSSAEASTPIDLA